MKKASTVEALRKNLTNAADEPDAAAVTAVVIDSFGACLKVRTVADAGVLCTWCYFYYPPLSILILGVMGTFRCLNLFIVTTGGPSKQVHH